MEGNKLLLLGQGHSADGGERPGAGGGGAGVRVVVRLCLGGRSRSRDLTASAELHMALGTSLLTRRDKSSLSPSSASALMEGQVRQGEEMSRRTVRDDRASVVDPRSGDLDDSADPEQQTKRIKIITLLKNYALITSHYINNR